MIILEYFLSKIGRKIRIFSLCRKNNILIQKKECRPEKLSRMGYDIPNVHCAWRLQFISSHLKLIIIVFTKKLLNIMCGIQRTKKVLSDRPGLVDFAIGLVNSVFNLPDGQVMFYEEFE